MFKFLVTVRYANGITRYTEMRARTPEEACELARSAFFIEGERAPVKSSFAELI